MKVHGVSLSLVKYPASSRECQIRWNLKGDSEGIMTPFVQDTNYVPMNFAQLTFSLSSLCIYRVLMDAHGHLQTEAGLYLDLF